MSIIVKSISYIHPDRMPLFANISFSVLKGEKTALVGNNGSGKSTLLKIIAGVLPQSEGEIIYPEKPYYIPQHTGQYDNCTIAEALEVESKLHALHKILTGNMSAENLTTLDDDWEIENRIEAAFSFWGITHLLPGQPMRLLSGGEKTKVFLAGIQIYSPQIVLLDEPTNHLDSKSRTVLYDFIRKSKSTILCVSHDRTLLNLLDTTFELSGNSITQFGGNYEFYREEKEKKLQSLQKTLAEKEKVLKQSVRKSREVAEKRQKQEARGKAQAQKKCLPRIVANGLKIKAEVSSAKSKEVQEDKIKRMSENLQEVKEQIHKQTVLQIDLRTSDLHKGKTLADAKEILFAYDKKELWNKPLTFSIRSGERICIEGDNGSGKTTLVKILTGTLQPVSGTIFLNNFDFMYIDQEYSIINSSVSLFEQIQQFNDRHLPEHELKMLLHVYQFPREAWDKKCGLLSGGEKMKLILCCMTVKNNTPDMVILDEPTNNLDIYSQKILTQAVRGFSGTVVLISHDSYFKNEVHINQTITLE